LVRTLNFYQLKLARLPGAHGAFLKTLRSFSNFFGFNSDFVDALHKKLPMVFKLSFAFFMPKY
jgi:hypothetical protein